MPTTHVRTLCHVLLIAVFLTGALAHPTVPTAAALAGVSLAGQTPIGETIHIVPDQMELQGPFINRVNATGQCTEAWMNGMPDGAVILGAWPELCDTSQWTGASASFSVNFPAPASPTVYTMRITWPDRDGKGLHSPQRGQMASITLDGRLLWTMRTLKQSTHSDYFALEHNPLLLTVVIREAGVHTFMIQVPPATAWDIGTIEFIPYAYPSQIRGIGYSPYRDCQYPGGPTPTQAEVEEDLFRIGQTNTTIRTYASTGVNRQIPTLAKRYGLKVYPGAWLDNKTTDEAEINGLISIVNTDHVAVDGVIVGNEFFLRNRDTPPFTDNIDKLANAINRVKSALPGVPVTTAEIDNLMFIWKSDSSTEIVKINPVYRKIIQAEDFVMVHIYPFWSLLPVEGAAQFAVNRYLAMQARLNQEFPGKRLVIGETGWPSSGTKTDPASLAIPSLENQRRYMVEFLRYAERANVDFLYFDGIDENWKVQAEGSVGPGWGYSYTDRSAKYPFFGVLVPPELLFDQKMHLPYLTTGFLAGPYFPLAKPAAEALRRPAPRIDAQAKKAASAAAPYYIYSDWTMGPEAGEFVPQPSLNGVTYFGCDRTNPAQGEMSIRQTFTPSSTVDWGSTVFLYPANNTGDVPGKDFEGMYNKLVFQARGEKGGEKIEFFVGGLGTQSTANPDSVRPAASTGSVQLTTSWQTYTINLVGRNLKNVVTGFGWSTTKCANPNGATFFLDDIRYEYEPGLPPVPRPEPFEVYTDAGAPGNHYYPTNWMGDAQTPGLVSLSECWTAGPHSGSTAIRITYPNKSSYNSWAGIYWVHPQENWGDRPGGYDLTGAKRLTFWARADAPATVRFFMGGVGYGATCSDNLNHEYPDSVCPKIETVQQLTTAWTQYTIDLTNVTPPRYFSSVVGGFGWVSDVPVTLYLDDIQYGFE